LEFIQAVSLFIENLVTIGVLAFKDDV